MQLRQSVAGGRSQQVMLAVVIDVHWGDGQAGQPVGLGAAGVAERVVAALGAGMFGNRADADKQTERRQPGA